MQFAIQRINPQCWWLGDRNIYYKINYSHSNVYSNSVIECYGCNQIFINDA